MACLPACLPPSPSLSLSHTTSLSLYFSLPLPPSLSLPLHIHIQPISSLLLALPHSHLEHFLADLHLLVHGGVFKELHAEVVLPQGRVALHAVARAAHKQHVHAVLASENTKKERRRWMGVWVRVRVRARGGGGGHQKDKSGSGLGLCGF